MAENLDFSQEPEAPAADKLQALSKYVIEGTKLEEEIEHVEGQLSVLKMSLHRLRTDTIPELMGDMSIDKIVVDGIEVSVKEDVIGSLPSADPVKGNPEKRAKALEWLIAHDAESLIKTGVSVEFGKGEKKAADRLLAKLIKQNYMPTMKQDVHAQTLQAFARERLADGKPINLELLGLSPLKIARFKEAKPKKKKIAP